MFCFVGFFFHLYRLLLFCRLPHICESDNICTETIKREFIMVIVAVHGKCPFMMYWSALTDRSIVPLLWEIDRYGRGYRLRQANNADDAHRFVLVFSVFFSASSPRDWRAPFSWNNKNTTRKKNQTFDSFGFDEIVEVFFGLFWGLSLEPIHVSIQIN